MIRAAGTLGLFVLLAATTPSRVEAPSHVAINEDMVLVIDGRKVFPIGFTMPPPADALAPNGKNAIAELSDAGATFLRTGVMGKAWDDEAIAHEKKWQDAAAKHGMHCWVFLRELASVDDKTPRREAMLRKVVTTFREHPGMRHWKVADVPA